ncbi:MAG: 3-(3-hydroxy-phenyl)propionate hydroxylase [Paracoccaceae bacterium]|jgi:3-(3-hydroxy-phenyl)propionate hydroxylase
MRPAGRTDTDSLYFTYPHFAPPSGADRDRLCQQTPVAIVGAGPIGMVAALVLAREGIRSVVFDAKDTFNDGSRAICVARQSFHILETVDAVAAFLEKSLGWTKGRSFYRGQQILEFEMPDSPAEKYRPMYNIQQQYIEQFLWDAVCKSDLIEARWQSRVTDLRDTDQGVTLSVSDPNGQYEMPAQWVLAADGAHSQMRKARGLRLKGENYEGRYVIADVQMDHDYPTIRRALFDPECRRGGTVLVHKQPDNIWRIDYQLRDGEDEAEAIKEDTVRESVAAVLADIGHHGPWDLEWWSVYSANTLALDDYRDNRVFFIGDSAHIVPIFGVRGLNNGLADAQNIGWKLAWVIKGMAGAELLDSYSPERRGATLDVFANASKSARFMTPPSAGWQVMRDAALGLALDHPFAGQLANPRQMTPYTYADSPAILADTGGFDGGPVAGSVAMGAKIGETFLSDLCGDGFSVLCFDADLCAALHAQRDGLQAIWLPYPSDAATAFAAQSQTAYLRRPDGHIAGRWVAATPQTVLAAFDAVTFCKKEDRNDHA